MKNLKLVDNESDSQMAIEVTGTARFLDRLGIVFSSLCVLHCILVPILLLAVPTLGAHLIHGQDSTHKILFAVVLLAATLAMVFGYRIHRNWAPVTWMLVGVGLVWIGTFGGEWFGPFADFLIVPAGGLVLIRAHFLNRHHCRACEEKHCCPAGPLSN